MLNLASWRQRLHRKRWRWVLRWALLLMMAVCAVTGSAWLALTQLHRAIPEYRHALTESQDQLAQTRSRVSALADRVRALAGQAKHVDSQHETMAARWRPLDPILSASFVRILALEITPERSTVRAQVASPEVLSQSVTQGLEMTAIRPLGFGYEVTLEVHHAP